jgi:CheY-like chemotaxis protein
MSQGKPRHVLIVDDSRVFLTALRFELEGRGYQTTCVHRLQDLARLPDRGGLDLVLIDVQMPEAFGDDVATLLRQSYGVAAPILLLSSLDDAELDRRASEAEVEGYVSKRDGVVPIADRVAEVLGGGHRV